jgi:hypothetical protein
VAGGSGVRRTDGVGGEESYGGGRGAGRGGGRIVTGRSGRAITLVGSGSEHARAVRDLPRCRAAEADRRPLRKGAVPARPGLFPSSSIPSFLSFGWQM